MLADDLAADYAGFGRRRLTAKGSERMAWKSPKIFEISLGCEINCYACAEIKA